MSNPIEIEALEVVTQINEQLYEKLVAVVGEKEYANYAHFAYVLLSSTGTTCIITFNDIVLWSSEDDAREYINVDTDEEDFEPLLGFVQRGLSCVLATCAALLK